jgi:hypothetical protein
MGIASICMLSQMEKSRIIVKLKVMIDIIRSSSLI